jgi:Iron permease FTR1 family.
VAVGREGAETVVFLYGAVKGSANADIALGSATGFLLALAAYWLLSRGSRFVSWRAFFRVTEVMLLLLGGALLVDGGKLVGLEACRRWPTRCGTRHSCWTTARDRRARGRLHRLPGGAIGHGLRIAHGLLGTCPWRATQIETDEAQGMNTATGRIMATGSNTGWLARLGLAMRRYRNAIVAAQWFVVLGYLVLVAVPAFLPLPPDQAHIWNNLTRFAQFMFWGIWWPFVILSIMALGRMWCGVLCPEGALTEWVSRFGLGRGIPRWMKWGGWPFVAFVMTTVFGQMTSVYEYPKPALLILGGSTVGAIAVGLIWGREKRVWCKHLCPVSGVFGLLARSRPSTSRSIKRPGTRRLPAIAPAASTLSTAPR